MTIVTNIVISINGMIVTMVVTKAEVLFLPTGPVMTTAPVDSTQTIDITPS